MLDGEFIKSTVSVCVCVSFCIGVCVFCLLRLLPPAGRWRRADGRAFHFNLPVGLGFLGGFALNLDEMVFNVFSLLVSLVFLINNHKSSQFVIYRMFCVFFFLFLSQPTRRKQKVFTNIYIKNIEQVSVVCRIFLF